MGPETITRPRTTITTADMNTPGPTIRLVSRYAGHRVILENGIDDYHVNGGVKRRSGGKYLKFSGHACNMPDDPEWHEALEQHGGYLVEFYRADDLKAAAAGVPLQSGIQVVEGMRTAGSAPLAPPLPGWNEMGPRELRPLIAGGQVGVPMTALQYEMTHRKREQVMTALSQAIARDSGEAPEPDVQTAAEHSVALPAEGVA